MKEKIYNSFKQYEYLSDDILNDILGRMTFKSFKRNHVLFKPGDDCNEIYFILNGVAISYAVNSKNVNMVLNFFHEGDWIEDIASIHLEKPVRFYFSTVENCEVLLLSKENLIELMDKYEQFKRMIDKMYLNYIYILQNRYLKQVTLTARERYDDFNESYPLMALRIPQKLLASYLGVTPEFLSKMRGIR